MDKVAKFFGNFRENFQKLWGSLNTVKRVAIIGGIAAVFLALGILFSVQKTEELSYLYKDLNSDDTHAISEELNKMAYKNFIIDSHGIKVPADQVIPLRLKLAEEGLPSHGQIGWEKFDQQDFTRTEFEQKIHKKRAIEGELARTIMSIDGVMSARVHVVIPNQSIFVEDEKEPTAAIYLKTKRGINLDSRQIAGIVHLASRSVEGMRPERVTIIDHEGKMLTKIESNDPAARQTQEMLAYRRTIERELEEKVRAIVGRVVGPDRVEAKIDVELDFTREEQTTSDIDPDRVVVLSSTTTNQEMDGSGLNPTGIPGSKSNVPGEQEELAVNSSRARSNRNSEKINYEIAKKQSHKILPVGTINRISAAVLVDGGQIYPTDGSKPIFEPRAEEEMQKIKELVKSAIGHKEGRDEVIVHNLMFELNPFQIQTIKEKKTENRNYISTLAISGAVALALVFFFAFIVRPYFRWLSYDPERKSRESAVEEFKPDLELGGIQNVQVKEDVPFEKMTPQEQIFYLAKHEPKRTTEAIRILLNPHASSSG